MSEYHGPERPRKPVKASAAFKAAEANDLAWFNSHPDKTRRQRRVYRTELPRQLRGHGVVSVLIERAGNAQFVRTFLDAKGVAVASGFDFTTGAQSDGGTIAVSSIGRCSVVRTDYATKDREYFRQHPEATAYRRPITPEEIIQVDCPPGHEVTGGTVLVTKLNDGMRTRQIEAEAAPLVGRAM
jgi:hypothetical protein